ncbi:hypothetical protein FRC01_006154 [Tulasnella sp. 417]|nr:hypothetical protein FRC01_006154 [Tulasnella sp. 417]
MRSSKFLPMFSALTVASAWEWPFFSNMVQATQVQLQVDVAPPPFRIAVIGAGAGGSSAAFWISKAKERQPDMKVEVHVFDKNYQIFEGFLKHSGAKLYLNTTITGLEKTQTPSGKTAWVLSGDSKIPSVTFDHVIFAAPFGSSGITLKGSSAEFTPKVDYVRLHVTLLSTTSRSARPERFGLAPGSHVGRMILTNANTNSNAQPQVQEEFDDPYAAHQSPPFNPECSGPGNVCARKAAEKPDFNSISYHKTIERNGREEHIWKVFSMERKSDKWLEDVFGEGTLGWIHRKEWNSYPVLPPVTSFPPIKADAGLWYVNSMEPWISTMETETLSSRNVVDNLLQEAFGHGICPQGTSPDGWGTKVEDKKVYGWDC